MGPIQKAVYEIISKKWLAYEITVAIGNPLLLSCFGLQIFLGIGVSHRLY